MFFINFEEKKKKERKGIQEGNDLFEIVFTNDIFIAKMKLCSPDGFVP